MADEKKQSAGQALFGIIVLAAGVWYFFGGGLEKHAAKEMVKIEEQVALDSIAQYNIVKANGTPMDVCVHAGAVAAIYLQAQNVSKYKKWKAVEKRECQAAGIPSI